MGARQKLENASLDKDFSTLHKLKEAWGHLNDFMVVMKIPYRKNITIVGFIYVFDTFMTSNGRGENRPVSGLWFNILIFYNTRV